MKFNYRELRQKDEAISELAMISISDFVKELDTIHTEEDKSDFIHRTVTDANIYDAETQDKIIQLCHKKTLHRLLKELGVLETDDVEAWIEE